MKIKGVKSRKATMEDIAQILHLAKEYYDELNIKEYGNTFDAKSVASQAAIMISNGINALFLAEHEGKVIGMAGVSICPSYFNVNENAIHSHVVFIKKEYRNKSAIRQLVSSMKSWAENKHLPWLQRHLTVGKKDKFTFTRIKNHV